MSWVICATKRACDTFSGAFAYWSSASMDWRPLAEADKFSSESAANNFRVEAYERGYGGLGARAITLEDAERRELMQ